MGEQKSYKWFLDLLSPHEGHIHGIQNVLYAKQTKYQQMEIVVTPNYGRCLILDGKMQSSEYDEYIYHEALVHPALVAHPDPKRIFIVGGGEGATLREVLRHRSVEHAMMVDIDNEVVESCRKYLPEWSAGAYDDKRTKLAYLDARKYLEETNEKFDLIIIDISEPVEEGPAYLLYTREFYQMVDKRLTKNGLISLQAGTTSVTQLMCFAAVYQTLKSVFPIVRPYHAAIPSFGLPWGFAVASRNLDPQALTQQEIDQRISERVTGELKYYNGETHQGQFMLAKPIRQHMEKQNLVIEDNNPLYAYH